MVADLADPERPSPNDNMYVSLDIISDYYSLAHLVQPRLPNTTKIAGAAGAITTLAVAASNPVAAITIPIVAGVVFAKWVYDVYKAT